MTLFDVVALGCAVFVAVGTVTLLFCIAFQNTETFMAIDEKIAKLIRGKEHGTD